MPAGSSAPPAVTIGPTTSSAARGAGFTVAVESDDPSVESVVAAVVGLLPRH
jgi:uroporphyrinogen-III synthase